MDVPIATNVVGRSRCLKLDSVYMSKYEVVQNEVDIDSLLQ